MSLRTFKDINIFPGIQRLRIKEENSTTFKDLIGGLQTLARK